MSTLLIAQKPTPLLNTPHFDEVFGGEELPLDDQKLLRPIEMIALPKTLFTQRKQMSQNIIQVETEDYPHKSVYIDARFVKEDPKAKPRMKICPPPSKIISSLKASLGLPYIWGGNCSQGIPEIRSLYKKQIPPAFLAQWTLAGLDCSGLLYEATEGYTPRNTSELLTFGQAVNNVKPLDIIVWPGHVIIALTPDTAIESLLGQGVITAPLTKRLKQLSKTDYLIRRFL